MEKTDNLRNAACVKELALPPAVREFQTQLLRISNVQAARRMWDRMLTDDDRKLLGDNFNDAYNGLGGTVAMWRRVRGVSVERAVIDVASGIGTLSELDRDWLLRETGEKYADSERTFDEAMRRCKLVLREKPRQAFWNGEPIEIDWDKEVATWNFFWELCQRGKQSKTLAREDISERFSPSAFSTRKARLVNHESFPMTMVDTVESVEGGYRLTLRPQDIRIFLSDEQGELTEWTGRRST